MDFVARADLAAMPATPVDLETLRHRILQLLLRSKPDSKTKLLVYLAARPAMTPMLEVLVNNVGKAHALKSKILEVEKRVDMHDELARRLEGELATARGKVQRLRADGEGLAAELSVAEEVHIRLEDRQRQLLVGLGEQNLRLRYAQLESGGQAPQFSGEVAAVGSKKILELGGCAELEESQRSASTACSERDLFTAGANPSDSAVSIVARQVDALEAPSGGFSTTAPSLAATMHASANMSMSAMPRPRSALAPTAYARPFHWRELAYPRRAGSAAGIHTSWTPNLTFGLRDFRYCSRTAMVTTVAAAHHRW